MCGIVYLIRRGKALKQRKKSIGRLLKRVVSKCGLVYLNMEAKTLM
jgi:hypothetical protein